VRRSSHTDGIRRFKSNAQDMAQGPHKWYKVASNVTIEQGVLGAYAPNSLSEVYAAGAEAK
jgi:hypothetical protein